MNRLLLLFDDLAASALGCYGGRVQTLQFDALAARSDLFTMCFADDATSAIEAILSPGTTFRLETIDDITKCGWSEALTQSSGGVISLRISNRQIGETPDRILGRILEILQRSGVPAPGILCTAMRGDVTQLAGSAIASVGELATHVPLLISLPQQSHCRRRSELMTTCDIARMLGAVIHSFPEYESERDALQSGQIQYSSPQAVATRTRDWLLIREKDLNDYGEQSLALYRKPDDMWEILDVSSQYPQLVEHFLQSGQLSFHSDT